MHTYVFFFSLPQILKKHIMDPEYSLQDIVRCYLCETPSSILYCIFCNKYVCKSCKEYHCSSESKVHKLVSLSKKQGCQEDSCKLCESFCNQCGIPVCEDCVSPNHENHETVDITERLEKKKDDLQRDIQQLEKYFLPIFQSEASEIKKQKIDIYSNSQKLKTEFYKHGEDMHREIDIIIRKLKADLDEINSELLATLTKQEDEIKSTLSKVQKKLDSLKQLLESNDVSTICKYKSSIDKFEKLPSKIAVILPRFFPSEISKENLFGQLSGCQSSFPIKTEKQSNAGESQYAVASSPNMSLIKTPWIIQDIKTEYKVFTNGLRRVLCKNDEFMWTCGGDNMMRLYNLEGNLIESIQTKSEKMPWDITITKCGDLVYTDYYDRSVNIIKEKQVQEVIKLKKWRPLRLCCGSQDDLLIIMISPDFRKTQVERFSGSKKIQSFTLDDNGQHLYSSDSIQCIQENRNQDICVARKTAGAVVVVNQAGEPRFTYTGIPFKSKRSFYPRGITTDSRSRILIADGLNDYIHILDHDGQFLQVIDNCDLSGPIGLSIDTKDNLLVAEYISGKVKKIKYSVSSCE